MSVTAGFTLSSIPHDTYRHFYVHFQQKTLGTKLSLHIVFLTTTSQIYRSIAAQAFKCPHCPSPTLSLSLSLSLFSPLPPIASFSPPHSHCQSTYWQFLPFKKSLYIFLRTLIRKITKVDSVRWALWQPAMVDLKSLWCTRGRWKYTSVKYILWGFFPRPVGRDFYNKVVVKMTQWLHQNILHLQGKKTSNYLNNSGGLMTLTYIKLHSDRNIGSQFNNFQEKQRLWLGMTHTYTTRFGLAHFTTHCF